MKAKELTAEQHDNALQTHASAAVRRRAVPTQRGGAEEPAGQQLSLGSEAKKSGAQRGLLAGPSKECWRLGACAAARRGAEWRR